MTNLVNGLAAIGILLMIWGLILRLSPELAEWRAAELGAWAGATRQTQKRLMIVWRLHWQTYHALKP